MSRVFTKNVAKKGKCCVLFIIITCTFKISVESLNTTEEVLSYEWDDGETGHNDLTKIRQGDIVPKIYKNVDHIILHNHEIKRNEEKAKSNKDVKHFLKGAVKKVRSWFGKKKPEVDHRVDKGGMVNRFIKGIGSIFKQSIPKGKRETSVKRQRRTMTRGWANAHFGFTPKGAFVAGLALDGREIYVAKAKVNGTYPAAICPGTLLAGRRCVKVPFLSWARCVFQYQILLGHSFVWYPYYYTKDQWDLHPQALIGGNEHHKGVVLTNYICRAYKDANLLIGKLQRDDRKCQVPYRGKTEVLNSYDLLIDWWE